MCHLPGKYARLRAHRNPTLPASLPSLQRPDPAFEWRTSEAPIDGWSLFGTTSLLDGLAGSPHSFALRARESASLTTALTSGVQGLPKRKAPSARWCRGIKIGGNLPGVSFVTTLGPRWGGGPYGERFLCCGHVGKREGGGVPTSAFYRGICRGEREHDCGEDDVPFIRPPRPTCFSTSVGQKGGIVWVGRLQSDLSGSGCGYQVPYHTLQLPYTSATIHFSYQVVIIPRESKGASQLERLECASICMCPSSCRSSEAATTYTVGIYVKERPFATSSRRL
nr:hypothetical protein CFP56_19399 [Quercus suber]